MQNIDAWLCTLEFGMLKSSKKSEENILTKLCRVFMKLSHEFI
jgi:hypothetical protein